jgi:adenine-specific DNA-methyltransferase
MGRLSDFFRVQRGIATGSNKYFVLDRVDAVRRRLPKRFLRPILPSPRHLKTTVIDADEEGYPLVDQQLCVIDCDLPEQVVESRHPALWEYLQSAEALGIMDGYLMANARPGISRKGGSLPRSSVPTWAVVQMRSGLSGSFGTVQTR